MRSVRLLCLVIVVMAIILPTGRAVALGWYPASTTMSGTGFFGIARPNSAFIRYIECSSQLLGTTPPAGFNGQTSSELFVSLSQSNCYVSGGFSAVSSVSTGKVLLIARSPSWGGSGGGDVILRDGTTFTFSLSSPNCTYRVNPPSHVSGKLNGFTQFYSELSINKVEVYVEATGVSTFACGGSGMWYLDTWHSVQPPLVIR